MGYPDRLLWALVLLEAALAKEGPVPKFSWKNTFCHLAVPRTVPASPFPSLSFLSRDPNGLALFRASWDERGHLLECTYWQKAAIVLPYEAACSQERGSNTSSNIFVPTPSPLLRRALRALEERQDTCSRTDQEPSNTRKERLGEQGIQGQTNVEHEAQAVARHQRVKRGFTMPGTLWCGVGDSAGNASQLGMFQGPDLCCRDHDLCAQTIAPLEYNYGVRNYRFHTISHCDCDSKFYSCLQSQEDTISDFVGTTFFNLLEIPCFVLEEKEACVQWYWWGGCKKYGPISHARLLQQNRYNATKRVEKPPQRKQYRQSHRMPGVGTKEHRSHVHPPPPLPNSPQKVNISAQPPSPTLLGLAPSMMTTQGKQAKVIGDHHTKGRPRGRDHRPGGRQVTRGPTEGTAQGPPETPGPDEAGPKPTLYPVHKTYQGSSGTCQYYRRLDQCQHKIEPGETKHQLYNAENHTLFHCNCTRRLAKVLKTKSPNEVEDKLWNLLLLSCFELRPPEDCDPSDGCRDAFRAVMVPARHLQRLWKKHLEGWSRVKGKAMEKRMKKRKRERRLQGLGHRQELRGAVTLYNKCLERVSAM